MNIDKQFATNLRTERRRQNISQEKLSALVGHYNRFIFLVEANKLQIKLRQAYEISQALNVPLSQLIGEE